tara:strand:+ start:3621 stop:4364 length:744 start_codon:yes stop_codon:yes gene_type:complete
MNISDQQLCAFLDAELPEDEMQAIRQLLLSDDDLAMRLADLAQVDEWVAANASEIDRHPVPASIRVLLQESASSDNVISLSGWRKLHNGLSKHAALAAGIALFFGIGLGQFGQQESATLSAQLTAQQARALDNLSSGEQGELANQQTMQASLSFRNQQGQYCRQYSLSDSRVLSNSIACREGDIWRIQATSFSQLEQDQNVYRSATKPNAMLDTLIDQIIEGEPLNKQQELDAISKAWVNPANKPGN